MNARLAWTVMARESRGARGRLFFFTLCIAIGVAAVVGVAGLAAAVEEGIRSHSRELLAADLSVSGRRPLPTQLDDFFPDELGLRRTNVRELATMAYAPGREGSSRLVELKVVDGEFPFYGELQLDPPGPLFEKLDARSAVVAPELLQSLGLALGDVLRVGGEEFRVAASVLAEPDRLDFSLALGPRVFLSDAGLERTSLLGVGNRVRYRALFRFPDGTAAGRLDDWEERLEEDLEELRTFSVRTHRESQSRVSRWIDRVESYLGLVALLSLILGGIGVAQIVRTWIASRVESIAVLRCIGFRPREILVLYLGHVLFLSFLGSLAGALVGATVPFLIPYLAPDFLPQRLVLGWQPATLVRGVLLGVGMAALFSVPSLTAVWRVSPARVLRNEAEPLPTPRVVLWSATGALAVGVLLTAWAQADSFLVALSFTAGLALLGALFVLAARTLIGLSRRLPRARLHPYLLHGVAGLARPGAGTVGAVSALALGIMVVCAMSLIERRFSREFAGALPEEAPTAFLVDIQPDQWSGVRGVLEQADARNVDAVPVIMARLVEIDGASVDDLVVEREKDDRRAGWVLTREQRLTYLDEFPEDNQIVEGAWWGADERAEISLEEGYAEDLGVGVGALLVFDVQGIPVEFVVTSLRSVVWQSFGINFFLIAEPGALDKAPQFFLAAARLDAALEQGVQDDIAATYPNVTMLPIRPILEKIFEVMKRLALGVRALGAVTALSGIVILCGSISATMLRRAREAALWKTLGITRRGVVLLFAAEYAILGGVSGFLGALGAWLLAWAFLEGLTDLPAELGAWVFLWGTLGGALLATAAGIAASGRALAARPIASLRG